MMRTTVRRLRKVIAGMDGSCFVVIKDDNGLERYAKAITGMHDGRLGTVVRIEMGRFVGTFNPDTSEVIEEYDKQREALVGGQYGQKT